MRRSKSTQIRLSPRQVAAAEAGPLLVGGAAEGDRVAVDAVAVSPLADEVRAGAIPLHDAFVEVLWSTEPAADSTRVAQFQAGVAIDRLVGGVERYLSPPRSGRSRASSTAG